MFELGNMLETRLTLWKKQNNEYPQNLLIYRDGVSESQYSEVMRYELGQIDSACRGLYRQAKQTTPKITFTVAAKRHHTRFYPTRVDGLDGNKRNIVDNTGNFTAGVVVDREITDMRTFDFYLQSHNAIQGNARPAHYVVLRNEMFPLTPPKGPIKTPCRRLSAWTRQQNKKSKSRLSTIFKA